MRENQVFAYFDESEIMFRSYNEITDSKVELASLGDVIDYYIQTGNTLERENEFVTTVDGDFYFDDGDYVELK